MNSETSVSNLLVLPLSLCKSSPVLLLRLCHRILRKLPNWFDFAIKFMTLLFRNIAARSCLFGDGGSVKLADFSFCSKLDPLRLVRGSNFRVPLKWTAPEVVSSEG